MGRCVGIQLKKHFSQNVLKALAAFEKRRTLPAVNIATRKRLPGVITGLQK
jgi:hypothetical protein